MNSVHLNALGIVCALGSGKATVSERLFQGADGVQRLADAVSDGSELPFAPVLDALPAIPAPLRRYASRNLALTLGALEEIDQPIRDAISEYGGARIAVVMGTSTSGISSGEDVLCHSGVMESGAFPAGFDFLQQEIGSVAESIAVHYALAGPAITVSTACSSGAKALSTARRLLQADLADAVIAGGCDSRCRLTLNGFHSLSALSRNRCLPFSANRDGTMIGEGAAIFLMTRKPEGPELCGVGESSDAHNMTAPDPSGAGAAGAMLEALRNAAVNASEISYVNLHGTATELNDVMESAALSQVFPDGVPCSSSKGQLGHTLGAAGAIEAAICWLALERNPARQLPPHNWDGVADDRAPLPGRVGSEDRLPSSGRHLLMSNSYAFGGSNISIILGSSR